MVFGAANEELCKSFLHTVAMNMVGQKGSGSDTRRIDVTQFLHLAVVTYHEAMVGNIPVINSNPQGGEQLDAAFENFHAHYEEDRRDEAELVDEEAYFQAASPADDVSEREETEVIPAVTETTSTDAAWLIAASNSGLEEDTFVHFETAQLDREREFLVALCEPLSDVKSDIAEAIVNQLAEMVRSRLDKEFNGLGLSKETPLDPDGFDDVIVEILTNDNFMSALATQRDQALENSVS
jgi:hypothetical protein